MLPSSLMLLNTAHEYLGRRAWCCNSDGALLRFYVSAAPARRQPWSGMCLCILRSSPPLSPSLSVSLSLSE